MIALGFGLGAIALTQAAVYLVDPDEAGIASALLNSAQQIGVALGLAVLAGVAAAVTAGSGSPDPQPLMDGYSTALVVGTGILLAAAALALLTLSGRVNTEEETAHTPEITQIRDPARSDRRQEAHNDPQALTRTPTRPGRPTAFRRRRHDQRARASSCASAP